MWGRKIDGTMKDKMTWHYGIVLHKPESKLINLEFYASVAEIFTDGDGIPVGWVEASLTYFESIDDLTEALQMIVDDIEKYDPIIYPDDFDVDKGVAIL
jgi:hypothetical protein